MDIQQTIIVGIVSSIIASLVFYSLMIMIKPRFIISDRICLKRVSEDEYDYIIKVANLTRSFITNVNYSLIYCEVREDGLKDIHTIAPLKPPIMNISKYSAKNTDYAVRLTYRIKNSEYKIDESSYFLFTFQAHHSFSNAMGIQEKIYLKSDLQEGIFETGKSTKILSQR